MFKNLLFPSLLLGANAIQTKTMDGPIPAHAQGAAAEELHLRPWTPTSKLGSDEVRVNVFRNACSHEEIAKWDEWGLKLDKRRMMMDMYIMKKSDSVEDMVGAACEGKIDDWQGEMRPNNIFHHGKNWRFDKQQQKYLSFSTNQPSVPAPNLGEILNRRDAQVTFKALDIYLVFGPKNWRKNSVSDGAIYWPPKGHPESKSCAREYLAKIGAGPIPEAQAEADSKPPANVEEEATPQLAPIVTPVVEHEQEASAAPPAPPAAADDTPAQILQKACSVCTYLQPSSNEWCEMCGSTTFDDIATPAAPHDERPLPEPVVEDPVQEPQPETEEAPTINVNLEEVVQQAQQENPAVEDEITGSQARIAELMNTAHDLINQRLASNGAPSAGRSESLDRVRAALERVQQDVGASQSVDQIDQRIQEQTAAPVVVEEQQAVEVVGEVQSHSESDEAPVVGLSRTLSGMDAVRGALADQLGREATTETEVEKIEEEYSAPAESSPAHGLKENDRIAIDYVKMKQFWEENGKEGHIWSKSIELLERFNEAKPKGDPERHGPAATKEKTLEMHFEGEVASLGRIRTRQRSNSVGSSGGQSISQSVIRGKVIESVDGDDGQIIVKLEKPILTMRGNAVFYTLIDPAAAPGAIFKIPDLPSQPRSRRNSRDGSAAARQTRANTIEARAGNILTGFDERSAAAREERQERARAQRSRLDRLTMGTTSSRARAESSDGSGSGRPGWNSSTK